MKVDSTLSFLTSFSASPDFKKRLAPTRDIFSKVLFYFASKLTNPVCYFHKEVLTRIWLPLGHSKYWGVAKTDHKCIEIFLRIIWAIPVSIYGVVGAPFALAGIVCRQMGKWIAPKSFLHLRFPDEKPIGHQDSKKAMVSWNMAGIAAGEPWKHGGVGPWKERVDRVLQLLLDRDPVIGSLLEVYDHDLALLLISKLKEKGYRDFFFNQGGWAFCNSGHFAFSRIKLEDAQFTPFDSDTGGSQWFVNKGFSKYKVSDFGENFWIIQTHLYPSSDDEGKEIRRKQVAQIKSTIDQNNTVLVMGDLNADVEEALELFPEREGYARFDTGVTSAPDALIHFVKTARKPLGAKERTIDHIFYREGSLGISNQEPFLVQVYNLDKPSEALSDHHLIGLKFV